MRRTTVVTALGVQVFSVVITLSGATIFTVTALSVLTVVLLVGGLRGPSETRASIEELVEERVTERTSNLVAQMSKYEQQASTDALTGLLNRRGGEAAIAAQILRSKSSSTPISFLLLDIDNFKGVNDRYGHAVGDAVLSAVALRLKGNLRSTDIAIRWGGEEYLVCLPETDLRGAVDAAEKIRKQMELLEVQQASVTVSIGCAELGQDDLSVALARADMNLYFAKSKGRNTVFPDFVQNLLDRWKAVD